MLYALFAASVVAFAPTAHQLRPVAGSARVAQPIVAAASAAKVKSIDIYFHAGGVFPGVPEPAPVCALQKSLTDCSALATKSDGSGQAFVDCFADKPDVYFNEAMLAKSVGKEAIKDFIDALPGQIALEPKEIFVATDETKVASQIEVTLPDGNKLQCVQFATLEPETAKYLTIDVFWHAGGVFPDVPEKSAFCESAEAAVDAFTAAHQGGGSGDAVAKCCARLHARGRADTHGMHASRGAHTRTRIRALATN